MELTTTVDGDITTKSLKLKDQADFEAHGDAFMDLLDSFEPEDEDVVGIEFIFRYRTNA